MPRERRTEGTGGRKGPPRRPGSEVADHGNTARPGSGQRRNRSTVGDDARNPSVRAGSKAAASRRSGPSARASAASRPRD